MNIRFLAEARADVGTSRAWYETHAGVRIGDEFAADVGHAVERIVLHPESSPLWPGRPGRIGVLRALLTRFPFAIGYLLDDETVSTIAVAHFRRRPGYWLRRVSWSTRSSR